MSEQYSPEFKAGWDTAIETLTAIASHEPDIIPVVQVMLSKPPLQYHQFTDGFRSCLSTTLMLKGEIPLNSALSFVF